MMEATLSSLFLWQGGRGREQNFWPARGVTSTTIIIYVGIYKLDIFPICYELFFTHGFSLCAFQRYIS